MKWALPSIICFVILVVFSVPVFHDAVVDARVLRVARTIAKDLMIVKRTATKESKNCGIHFNLNNNSYTLFYDSNNDGLFNYGDKGFKTVYLDQLAKNVVYSRLLDKADSWFKNATVVFDLYGKLVDPDINKNSVFLISLRNEQDKQKDRITRVYVGVDGRIDILRVDKVLDNGDISFDLL